MTAQRTWQEIEQVFLDAVEIQPSSRAEFLDRRCAGDAQFRRSVDELLAGHSAAEPQFIAPFEAATRQPVHIGRYRVVRLLASGGMGAVYEAEQESPRRTVAIKVLRAGIASPALARRFAQEAEVLARLRHPGIAQVYEAGTFDDGSGPVPFFAMECVDGARTITDFTKDRDPRQTLDLFLRACDAVHHGHQHGVIHRDLKPGNILVDRAGNPKVIDFGIARATGSPADTMHTSAGQLIGTIAYMSPEQCAGDPAAIDTRTDVYALGIVLYELLCGQTPFDSASKSLLETARSIREDQPARPSTIAKAIRGDLETIVLTAIHREPEHRYQTVLDFAADIRRFLANEPIAARPATAIYQLRMFARRHRGLAAGIMIAGAGLIIGTSTAVWQAVRATHQRDRALVAESSARDEADTANRMAKCLQDAFAAMDPRLTGEDGLSLAAILNTSAETVTRELKDKPLAQAALFQRLGDSYVSLGLFDRATHVYHAARKLYQDNHAPESTVASVEAALAGCARWQHNNAECERLSVAVLRRPNSPDLQVYRVAAGRHLALALLDTGRDTEAQTAAEAAIAEAGRSGPLAADLRIVLARVLERRGKNNQARESLLLASEDNAAGLAAVLARFELGGLESRLNRPEAAATAIQSGIQAWKLASKIQDRNAASLCANIGVLLQSAAQWDAAENFLREAIERHTHLVGPRHLSVGTLHTHLAAVLEFASRPAEAAASYKEAVSIYRGAAGEEHPEVGTCLFHLARIAVNAGDRNELVRIREEAMSIQRSVDRLPDSHAHRSGMLLLLGFVDMHIGDPTAAEQLLRECVRLRESQLGPDAKITVYAQTVLGACLARQGRFEEAEHILQTFVPRVEARYIPGSYMSAEARKRLVDLYIAWDKPELAKAAADAAPTRK